MKFKTIEANVKDINKVFYIKDNCWIDKPNIANIGHIINERFIKTETTIPIKRGIKISSLKTIRDTYIRKDMATINYKTYDDAVRSLKTPAYKIWQIIKKYIIKGNITVKLNITIVKDILNITDASNANKAIKNLITSGLIIKVKGYKDLYSINPNIYFRGDYNKVAIDYINNGYNIGEDDIEEEVSDWCDESNAVNEDEEENMFSNAIKYDI